MYLVYIIHHIYHLFNESTKYIFSYIIVTRRVYEIFLLAFFYKYEKKIIVLKMYWLEHLYFLTKFILFEEHNFTLHMTMLVSSKNNNNTNYAS